MAGKRNAPAPFIVRVFLFIALCAFLGSLISFILKVQVRHITGSLRSDNAPPSEVTNKQQRRTGVQPLQVRPQYHATEESGPSALIGSAVVTSVPRSSSRDRKLLPTKRRGGSSSTASPAVLRSSQDPLDDATPNIVMRRVTSLEQLRQHRYFRIQHAESGLWLSRAIDTGAYRSREVEKIWKIEYNKKYEAWTVKGHTRMYLTCELTDKLTVDRMWARSFEQFYPSFVRDHRHSTEDEDDDAFLVLKSRRNKMYVATFKDKLSLVANAEKVQDATRWKLFVEPNQNCTRKEVECWGKEPGFRVGIKKSYSLAKEKRRKEQSLGADYDSLEFPLFGSPKPLVASSPKDSTDHYDPYIIASRTLRNWQRIEGMKPLIFTDDKLTVALTQNLSKDAASSSGTSASTGGAGEGNCSPRPIQVDENFEIQKKFGQPTYRGLFKRAMELYPNARAFMYSNSDILFTPSLSQTIRHVVHYVDDLRKKAREDDRPFNARGWMMVGQRVNYDVPANWEVSGDLCPAPSHNRSFSSSTSSAGTGSSRRGGEGGVAASTWVDDIEQTFAKAGRLFQSDAEDYFIVSREMFDWEKIPDFVVGGVAFDNWITSKACKLAITGEAIVVDGSKTITALHQNHGTNIKNSHLHPKSEYNSRLAYHNGGWSMGHTADAPLATERHQDGSLTIYDKHRLLFE